MCVWRKETNVTEGNYNPFRKGSYSFEVSLSGSHCPFFHKYYDSFVTIALLSTKVSCRCSLFHSEKILLKTEGNIFVTLSQFVTFGTAINKNNFKSGKFTIVLGNKVDRHANTSKFNYLERLIVNQRTTHSQRFSTVRQMKCRHLKGKYR